MLVAGAVVWALRPVSAGRLSERSNSVLHSMSIDSERLCSMTELLVALSSNTGRLSERWRCGVLGLQAMTAP